jgi:cation diffusion facilitator CzcD-associated flavoprotein CzcO
LIAKPVDIVIIGAGPYGLSLAAHLRDSGRSVRIFGSPMESWSNHMPQGMHLKSEGFASDLYDPGGEFPLKAFCALRSIPYADIGLPVAIDTFIEYGREFQRRYVPELENTRIVSLKESAGYFELTTATGEIACARRVVVAAGIVNFAYLPPVLAATHSPMISHSSQHSDLRAFKGRKVAVVGGGASALDIAALLLEIGAEVDLITRRQNLQFHDPPNEPRPLLQRLKAPRSGLGTGWRSRMCTDIPLVFHALPQALRVKVVQKHLGPAPCWFVRDAVAGRLPMHMGTTVAAAHVEAGQMHLALTQPDRAGNHLDVDHVIAATGYRPAVSRLSFIDETLQSRLIKLDNAPVLSRHFESSIPGLYFVGVAAANSFGPLLRFAFGAKFAAKRVASRLTKD